MHGRHYTQVGYKINGNAKEKKTTTTKTLLLYTFLGEDEACCAGVTAEELGLAAAVVGLPSAVAVGFDAGAADLVAAALSFTAGAADLGVDTTGDFETTCS